MIGKRFKWDSNFTIKSLQKEGLTEENDPLFRFPFLSLKGLRMEDVGNLICPSCNSPRGYREIFVSNDAITKKRIHGKDVKDCDGFESTAFHLTP